MRKRIGIDARLYFQTGVGTYLRNLLHSLQHVAPDDLDFYIYLLPQDAPRIVFNKKNFFIHSVNAYWHTVGEQTKFLYETYNDTLNLMHFTYFSYPVLYRRPFVSTVHDATPLFFKTGKASTRNPFEYAVKHRVFKAVIKEQVKNAKKIITPSKTVKKQLISLYGHSIADKIIPIYEGVDHDLRKAKTNDSLTNIFKTQFFLYVGNFYPHKNVELLIRAFQEIDATKKLILVGPDDFFAKRLSQLVKDLKLRNRIKFYHNATRADLKFFYTHALGLIHPSLSEGFGLPIVEAAYFNCPVIASNIEVFKELLAEEYVSFDPHTGSDLVNKVEEFLTKKPKFDYKHIVSKYSFEEMTKKTLDVYASCL